MCLHITRHYHNAVAAVYYLFNMLALAKMACFSERYNHILTIQTLSGTAKIFIAVTDRYVRLHYLRINTVRQRMIIDGDQDKTNFERFIDYRKADIYQAGILHFRIRIMLRLRPTWLHTY